MINTNDKAEFIGQIIDIFEDFLDEKGIVIENPERLEDPDFDPENPVNIYGSDYGDLQTQLEATMVRWGIMREE